MKKYFISFRVNLEKVSCNNAFAAFMQDCTVHFGYNFTVEIKRTDFDIFSIVISFSDDDFAISATRENILYAIRKGREYFGGEFAIEYQVRREKSWFLADCVFKNGKCTDHYFDVIRYND